MGADLKRKEARKRKFGGQNSETLIDAGIQCNIEGTSVGDPSHKKLKQAPPPTSSRILLVAEGNTAGKVAVVNDAMYQRREESPTQKSQRFIVFIGPSTFS